jgi:hypothetical protein
MGDCFTAFAMTRLSGFCRTACDYRIAVFDMINVIITLNS